MDLGVNFALFPSWQFQALVLCIEFVVNFILFQEFSIFQQTCGGFHFKTSATFLSNSRCRTGEVTDIFSLETAFPDETKRYIISLGCSQYFNRNGQEIPTLSCGDI